MLDTLCCHFYFCFPFICCPYFWITLGCFSLWSYFCYTRDEQSLLNWGDSPHLLASASFISDIVCITCIPALLLVSWTILASYSIIMSSFEIFITTFPAILCKISLTPIGRRAGILSRGISLHAKNAMRDICSFSLHTGSLFVQIFLITFKSILVIS